MASIHKLTPKKGSVHRRKRLGTGQGSGHGQTCTRGQKGQHSTSGGTKPRGFQGGQTTLWRRTPKSGFNNTKFRTEYEWVNLSVLEEYFDAGADITPATLKERGFVKCGCRVKVLGNGDLKKSFKVSAHAFSKSAIEKIEKAGGKASVLEAKKTETDKK
ncbi:MAG: 50S ribosomal protein L15 [Elusimicrobiales bacterium]|nr:50S ribosomal protein L15 [Elusimicrobiales bacterium]